MTKLTTLAASAALALVCASPIISPAFARPMTYSTIVAHDHSMRTSRLIGMDVFNEKGKKIGKIEDILVKESASEPLAVLSVGAAAGGDEKMVAVPLNHVKLKSDRASMSMADADFASMPAWKFAGLEGGGG